MKAWITRYALTNGIIEADVINVGPEDGVAELRFPNGNIPVGYYFPKEYALTREEAVVRAEAMRVKKITSLHKQIEKLEKMRFE